MTVGELIEKLKAFDPSTPVVTPGFDEFGYDNVAYVALVELVKTIDPRGHGPEFEDSTRREMNMETAIGTPFKAVCLDWRSE